VSEPPAPPTSPSAGGGGVGSASNGGELGAVFEPPAPATFVSAALTVASSEGELTSSPSSSTST
jgi:hypothetical protein